MRTEKRHRHAKRVWIYSFRCPLSEKKLLEVTPHRNTTVQYPRNRCFSAKKLTCKRLRIWCYQASSVKKIYGLTFPTKLMEALVGHLTLLKLNRLKLLLTIVCSYGATNATGDITGRILRSLTLLLRSLIK